MQGRADSTSDDETVRVLVVDDEPALRRVWEKCLTANKGFQCAGALGSTSELLENAAASAAHVALVDLSMTQPDPISAIRTLAREVPALRVIVYTGRSDVGDMRAAFDAGAWGYVDKLAPVDEVLRAIRQVAAGETAFPDTWLSE